LEAENFIISAVPDFSRQGSAFPTASVSKLFGPTLEWKGRLLSPPAALYHVLA
jgi:hypothetical protein